MKTNHLITTTLLLLVLTAVVHAANVVTVKYNGTEAVTTVSAEAQPYTMVETNGANVTVTQTEEADADIAVTLEGETANGSFTLNAERDATVTLNGLTLTSQEGYAMKTKNKKTVRFIIADGTVNTLTDASLGTHKACLLNKGNGIISGAGTLNINGNTKQAYKGEGTLTIDGGDINVKATVKDGFNLDSCFVMNNGKLDVTTTGGGFWDEEDMKTKAPSCINTAGNVTINNGTLTLLSTGEGGKGINCDSIFTMKGGNINVTTTGRRYIDPSCENLRDTPDDIPDNMSNSPKAVKAEKDMLIANGTIRIHTTEDGGEGLESKAAMTLTGGDYNITTYDDCINAAGNVTISGGTYYLSSLDNDGIDTNSSLYVKGGDIVTMGNYLHELGIDVNDRSPYKKLYITGGSIVCIGGDSKQVPKPVITEGAQPTMFFTGLLPMGTMTLKDAEGNNVMAFDLQRDYTTEAGGTAPVMNLMLTSPQLKTGAAYTLYHSAEARNIAQVEALRTPYTTMTAVEKFARESFTLATTTLPYRKAVINSNGEKMALVIYLHGGSSKGNDNEKQLLEPGIDSIYNYIADKGMSAVMLVPQCSSTMSWGGKMNPVLAGLINKQVAIGNIDPDRIYLLGGSMGGTGTWSMLNAYTDLFAAAMPVAGNTSGLIAENVAKTPVCVVMGLADNIMDADAACTFANSLKPLGDDVNVSTEEGWTHEMTCIQSYNTERLNWLFSHTKGDNPTAVNAVETNAEPVSLKYYTVSGTELTVPPTEGIYVTRATYSDGTVKTWSRVRK